MSPSGLLVCPNPGPQRVRPLTAARRSGGIVVVGRRGRQGVRRGALLLVALVGRRRSDGNRRGTRPGLFRLSLWRPTSAIAAAAECKCRRHHQKSSAWRRRHSVRNASMKTPAQPGTRLRSAWGCATASTSHGTDGLNNPGGDLRAICPTSRPGLFRLRDHQRLAGDGPVIPISKLRSWIASN